MPCTPRSRFSAAQGAGDRLLPDGVAEGFSEGVSEPEDALPPDQQPVSGKAPHPF